MRSLYNPFSPLRFLDLWSVAVFDTGGDSSSDDGGNDGGGEGSASSGTAGANVTATATGATQFGVDYGDDNYNDSDNDAQFETYVDTTPVVAVDTDTGGDGSASTGTDIYGLDTSADTGGYDEVGINAVNTDFDTGAIDTSATGDGGFSVATTQNVIDNLGGYEGSTYDEIPTTAQINAASGFTDNEENEDDDIYVNEENYTPTSAEVNAAIANAGGINLTDPAYAETVDFTTTASGQDYNTTAEADTDESGFQFVADIDPVTGENTTSTLASDDPVVVTPVDDTPVVAPVFTDSAGVQHPTQLAADAADAQYAETARLADEARIAEENRIQNLIDQVLSSEGTSEPVVKVEDADLGAAIAAAEAFDSDNKIVTGPDLNAPLTSGVGYADILKSAGVSDEEIASMREDILTEEVVEDDPFAFLSETNELLAELGVAPIPIPSTETGINLASTDDVDASLNTSLADIQALVDSGVARPLAESIVGSGQQDIVGINTAPSVMTDLALGSDDGSTIEADIAATLMPRETFGDVFLGTGSLDAFGGAGADVLAKIPSDENFDDAINSALLSNKTDIPSSDDYFDFDSGTGTDDVQLESFGPNNQLADDEITGLGSFENILNTQPIDQGPLNVISNTIKELEGFADGSYFDVTAERGGFGSDTKTDPITGEVTTITEGMTVTKEEAEADLNRRLTTEFVPSVVDAVGADVFYSMPSTTQAALTSIAYNYGVGWADKLPTLAAAARTGDKDAIANAIDDRSVDNDGINAGRRTREANMVRKGVPLGGDSDAYVGMAKSASETGASTSNTGIPTAEEINGGSGATGTDLYLSAMAKIEGRDPNAEVEVLTEQEQRALYGARGQTPNAAETSYLEALLSDAKHKEDGPIGVDGQPIYKAGDYVTTQSGGQKFEDFAVGFIDTFLNPLSILGNNFTLGGANANYVEKQLEAYKNGGTFIYGEDGATVVGVASPNFDASGDGNNDTVVLFNEEGEKTVTGDGIATTDVITSNANSDGEEFDIDIVNSVKTYENTEDGVVVGVPGGEEEETEDNDNDFIVCEEGFEFDPKEGICMPIAVVGGGTGTAPPRFSDDKRDRTDPVFVTLPKEPVRGLKIRGAKQFAQGGMVTSNIDNFLQSFRG